MIRGGRSGRGRALARLLPRRRVLLLGCSAVLLAACAAQRPNVLLIVIDTARADRFSFNGYGRDTSPRIAALAAEGVVYENAYAPAPWTVPSHGSLFTGLFPSAHGADSGHLFLDEGLRTLADALGEAGYRTLGYTENPWTGKAHGFHQGFDTYDEIWKSVPGTEGPDMGAALVGRKIERWLAWRDGNRDASRRPFFIFINYFEPHLPYSPPEPERARFLRPPVDREAVGRLRRLKHPREMPYVLGLTPLAEDDRRVLSDLYDGEIAYVDRRIGELMEILRRHGVLDRTVVAITSDHGEMLGEHGLLDHKLNVYEPLLRIPLVLRYPPAVAPGQRLAGPVMLQDLYPTLLGLAGARAGGAAAPPGAGPPEARVLPGVAGLEGRPRDPGEPLIAEYARPVQFLEVIAERYPDADTRRWDRALVAYRLGREKLHWASDGEHRLFDLGDDPDEDRDLAAAASRRVAALAGRVEAWLRRPGTRPPIGRPAGDRADLGARSR